MTWKKGQSGNPSGRPNDKPFYEELRKASAGTDPVTKKRKLRVIAEKLVECAMGGESWAIAQVADRLDGKPAQAGTVTVQDKRDATDWSTAELVALLNDAAPHRSGIAAENGRDREPDKVR